MALTVKDMTLLATSVGFDKKTAAIMGAIGMAESSGNPTAVNSSSGAVGLWQINQPVWVKTYPGWTSVYLMNTWNNAKAAKVVYDKQGLKAWTAYTNGAYKQFYTGEETATGYVPGIVTLPADIANSAIKPISDVTGAAVTAATAVEKGAAWITTPSNWVRVLYFVGGTALLLAGVAYIGKGTVINSVGGQVVKAVKPVLKGKK